MMVKQWTKNQIDFIMSSDRKIARNCEVITKVNIGSDHIVVRARTEKSKKIMRLKEKKRTKEKTHTPKSDLRMSEKSITSFTLDFF